MVLVLLLFALSFPSLAQAAAIQEEITAGSAFTFSLKEQHPMTESIDASSLNSEPYSSTTGIANTGDPIPFSIVIATICVSGCALCLIKKQNKN